MFLLFLHDSVLFLHFVIMKTSLVLSPRKKTAILALKDRGISNRSIAQQLEFSHTSINQFLKNTEQNGVERKPGSGGHNRISTPAQDKTLEKLCLKDRFATGNQLRDKWRQKTNVQVQRKQYLVNFQQSQKSHFLGR